MGADAHGRAPGSGAAGGVDLERAEAMQPVGKLSEGAAGEPGEGDKLAAVSVAGELEADAGLLDDRQEMGSVVEQDAGQGGVREEGLKIGAKMDGGVGVGVGNAEDLEAVDVYLFVDQDADTGLDERMGEVRFTTVLLVIAGSEEGAVGRREIFEGSDEAGGVGMDAVEKIAGKEDNIGLESSSEATMRRQKPGPLMLPRCRSLIRRAVRPHQEGGRLGS